MGAELELPLLEIVKKKRGQRFASVRPGYDPKEVDDFLVKIVSRIEDLNTELDQDPLAAKVPPEGKDLAPVVPPAPAREPSDGYAKRIARLGLVGEREVATMLSEAKAEAATIVSEAKGEAERIRSDAQGGARRSVEEARAFLTQVEADAGKMLSGVVEGRRQTVEEFAKMQEHLLNVAKELDLVLNPVRPEEPGA